MLILLIDLVLDLIGDLFPFLVDIDIEFLVRQGGRCPDEELGKRNEDVEDLSVVDDIAELVL